MSTKHDEQQLADERALAQAIAEGGEREWAIIRAAFAWGYDRGWREGFDRSFERAPVPKSSGEPWEDVVRARGEVRMPDGTYRTIPRAGDYPGGAVPPW